MKIWGLTEAQLHECAEEIGVKLYEPREEGRAIRLRILPTGERIDGDYKYQRTSASGYNADRRVHAVCWHGYRDFMLAVFERNPEARIKTMMADYKGREDFLSKYEETGYRNVGSMMYPMQAREVCNCANGSWLIDLSLNHNVSVYQMKQSTIQGCPFYIFDPAHYRADGSCKCNDPHEQERLIREYDYSPSDFNKELPPNWNVTCSKCGKSFSSSSDYHKHLSQGKCK